MLKLQELPWKGLAKNSIIKLFKKNLICKSLEISVEVVNEFSIKTWEKYDLLVNFT